MLKIPSGKYAINKDRMLGRSSKDIAKTYFYKDASLVTSALSELLENGPREGIFCPVPGLRYIHHYLV